VYCDFEFTGKDMDRKLASLLERNQNWRDLADRARGREAPSYKQNRSELRDLIDSKNMCIGQYDHFLRSVVYYRNYNFHHIGYSRYYRYLINLLRRLHQKIPILSISDRSTTQTAHTRKQKIKRHYHHVYFVSARTNKRHHHHLYLFLQKQKIALHSRIPLG